MIVGEGEDEEAENDSNRDSIDEKKKKRAQKIIVGNPEKTLEKESNINLTAFDTQHEVDPLFR